MSVVSAIERGALDLPSQPAYLLGPPEGRKPFPNHDDDHASVFASDEVSPSLKPPKAVKSARTTLSAAKRAARRHRLVFKLIGK
jgi:hypothetical protein